MVLGPPPLAQGGVGESGGDVKQWPTHEFELHSPLSTGAARSAMATHVEAYNPYRFQVTIGFWTVIGNKGPDMFEGDTVPDGFCLRRLVGYFSYFVPHTDVAIRPRGSGSALAVSIRPPALAYVVLLIPTVVLVTAVMQNPSATALIGCMLFCAAVAALLLGHFRFEAAHQERVLRDIFRVSS
jgi:hypothetical protein